MADIKNQGAKAPESPSQVKCKVVSNYGGKLPGMMILVDEKEYNRLREPVLDDEGKRRGFRYPILVTEADEVAQIKAEQAEREAQMRRQAELAEQGSGWADMERQSLATQRARFRQVKEEEERIAKETAA